MSSPVSSADAARALSVSRAATRWALAPARWAQVQEAVRAALRALAADDGPALRAGVSAIAILGPVRQATRGAVAEAPGELLADLAALIGALTELDAEAEPGAGADATIATFPVDIYLLDDSGHDQVERAVEELARSAGLSITEREDPVFGSWFRRMRAELTGAGRSPLAQGALADGMHRAELELVLRADADVSALLMVNLAPLISSLQGTAEAVIRVGAILVVKHQGALFVSQLTARQQLVLNHSPHLLTTPGGILQALSLPSDETTAIPANPA